jgi:response regulator NasT
MQGPIPEVLGCRRRDCFSGDYIQWMNDAMTDAKQLKIVVINSVVAPPGSDRETIERADRARDLRIGLLEGGYNILAALPPDGSIEEQITRLRPDLIIVDAQSDATLKRVVAATT